MRAPPPPPLPAARSGPAPARLRPTQEDIFNTITEWLGDVACNRNTTVLLMAGTLYMHEGNYAEALKICHGGQSLEM